MISNTPPSRRFPSAKDFLPRGFGTRVKIVPAATIPPESVKWIWYGWLAAGKLHMLAGQPCAGKTSIAINMAATISRGAYSGVWPDGSSAPPGKIVIWTGEDGVADTIVPRLIAAGANMNHVWILTGTEENGRERAFDPARDLERLIQRVAEIGGVSLIVIDPILQVVAGDSHKNADVRRALEPLVAFAEEHGIAILGITHVNKRSKGKDPLDRVTGSLAYTAVARVVMLAVKARAAEGDEKSGSCVLVRAKTNIGPSEGGFAYRVEPQVFQLGAESIRTSVLIWNPVPLEGSAEEILRHAEGDDDFVATNNALAAACNFLKTTLASGGVPNPDIIAMANVQNISLASLKRAKTHLGIVSIKRAARGDGAPCNYWYLPGVFNDQEASCMPGTSSAPMQVRSIFDQAFNADSAGKEWLCAGSPSVAQFAPVAQVVPVDSIAPVEPVAPLDPIPQSCIEQCRQKFAAQSLQPDEDMADFIDRIVDEVTDEFCDDEGKKAHYREALSNLPWWSNLTA